MEIGEVSSDKNHIDRMSSQVDNRTTSIEQMLTMDTQYIASRTESLHARTEKAIEKLQGHVKLSQSPELRDLIGQGTPDQTIVGTQTILDVIEILRESMMNSSTLELDAAQDSFAAEESHMLSNRIRTMTLQMYTLIKVARDASAVPNAEVEGIERDLRLHSHSKI